MKASQRSVVVGVFQDRSRAQQAVQELRNVGFSEDHIGVVTRDETTGKTKTAKGDGSYAGEGAAIGAAAGAGVGALWALGIAAGLLPGIGPAIIGGGMLASLLASAATGAAVAGIVGALVGLGIPEEEAKYYESEVHAGRTLVTVRADGRYDEALAILRRYGAYDASTRGTATATGATHTATTAGTTTSGTAKATGASTTRGGTMEVREEELRARKESVQAGEVSVRKEVKTEHKTLEVPVTREEVVIERRPASGQASTGDIRTGEEIRIPVREEQVTIEKTPVVKEEVHVGKRQVQETKQVSGTVRKEEVRVEEKGDVDVKHTDETKQRGKRKT